jgi:hypothetical protein
MYFCTVLVSFSSYDVFQYTYSVLACDSHKPIDGLSAMLRLSYRAIWCSIQSAHLERKRERERELLAHTHTSKLSFDFFCVSGFLEDHGQICFWQTHCHTSSFMCMTQPKSGGPRNCSEININVLGYSTPNMLNMRPYKKYFSHPSLVSFFKIYLPPIKLSGGILQ